MLAARVEGVEPQEFVGRLARFEFEGADGGDPVASVGPVRVLASGRARRRGRCGAAGEAPGGAARRGRARRAKLANEGFVAKAPPEVVEEERGKLERYRAELEELSE